MKQKYNNRKVNLDGLNFDSTKECKRYKQLKAMEDSGSISDLRLQVKYELIPSQYVNGRCAERACTYIADFVYVKDGETIVEDVKGFRGKTGAYSVFVIKRKLMLQKYGVRIKEI